MMAMSDDDRKRTLDEIDHGFNELNAVLATLNDDDFNRPNTVGHWSGKDLLSHIAAWEIEGARHIAAIDAGDDDSIPPQEEFDAWNESQVQKTRDWTVQQVQALFESAHRDFVQAVATSPSISSGLATGLTSHHYGEHIEQFRQLRQLKTNIT